MHLSTAVGTDMQQDIVQVAGTVPRHHCHQPNGTFPACMGTPGSLLTMAKQPCVSSTLKLKN